MQPATSVARVCRFGPLDLGWHGATQIAESETARPHLPWPGPSGRTKGDGAVPPTNSCQNAETIDERRPTVAPRPAPRGRPGCRGFAAGLPATFTIAAGNPKGLDTNKILNYNPAMEYRRCGKTGMMISAVAMGGHWKRIPDDRRRRQAAGRATSGVPSSAKTAATSSPARWSGASTGSTPAARPRSRPIPAALRGRRDKMHLACSWYEEESATRSSARFEKLKGTIDKGLKEAGLETATSGGSACSATAIPTARRKSKLHEALQWAKKTGRARFAGVSCHDRPHLKRLIEQYPQAMDIVVTPYTARTKVVADEDGLWAAMKKHEVGWFGIKPFASNSIFKGDSSPNSPTREEAAAGPARIRSILCNPAITAPIPG